MRLNNPLCATLRLSITTRTLLLPLNRSAKPSPPSDALAPNDSIRSSGGLLDEFDPSRWLSFSLIGFFSLICCPILSADDGLGNEAIKGTQVASLTELRNQTRELLRREAILKSGPAKDEAATALCDMYVILRQDDRYADSEMLQQDAGKIRRRLLTTAQKRKGRLRREKIDRPTNLSKQVDMALENARQRYESESSRSSNSKKSEQRDSSGVESQNTPTGRAAGSAMDNGWQLVELIERIVEPDFWESTGGPGSIYYFAARRVLVVRATSDVHEQVRELLLKLPR